MKQIGVHYMKFYQFLQKSTKYYIIVGRRIRFIKLMGEGNIKIISSILLSRNIY